MTGSIIVGVDESPRSGAALAWAVRQARRRHATLRLIHAWAFYVPVGVGAGLGQSGLGERAESEARTVLDHACQQARGGPAGAELSVTGELVLDQAGPALARASQDADMVVLGSRGAGGLAGQLLGSVSLYVAGHAHSPVVVVPDRSRADKEVLPHPAGAEAEDAAPVLLAVDVLHPVGAAIDFACAEAMAQDGRLRVLHAWTYPVIEQPRFANPLAFSPQVADADAREALEKVIAPWREKYPGVAFELVTTHDRPARALVDASAHTDLLVVGAHRRVAHVPGLALGLINHAVLHHARCPVALVPDR